MVDSEDFLTRARVTLGRVNHETGEVDPFNTFIALMLSSQTKDQVVGEAVERLKASPGGLSVDSVLAMSDEVGEGAAVF